MLSGQDFRWREQRDLITVFNRDHGRLRCHDCLSATYVAVEQTIHGMRPLHVVSYLLHYPALRVSWLKRQHVPDLFARTRRHRERNTAGFARFRLLQSEAALQPKELVEYQSHLCRPSTFVQKPKISVR